MSLTAVVEIHSAFIYFFPFSCVFYRRGTVMKTKSSEDDGVLTSAVKPKLKSSWGKNEKENCSKNRCLILRSCQKENGYRMAKKWTKRARQLPESTAFIAKSKLNKVEKVTKCYTAENR